MKHDTENASEGSAADAVGPKGFEPIRRATRTRRSFVLRPSIAQRVFLVGALPIGIISLVGFLSILLMGQADIARQGAVNAATVYRQVVSGMAARDAFIDADATDRQRHAARFSASTTSAGAGLANLAAHSGEAEERSMIRATIETLNRYVAQMNALTRVTSRNDDLVAEMDRRLASLISLTEEARERQRVSNLDLIETLRVRGDLLLSTREIVGATQALRLAISDAALTASSGRSSNENRLATSFEIARIRNAFDVYASTVPPSATPGASDEPRDIDSVLRTDFLSARTNLDWLDRQLKVNGSAERALQGELFSLFSYSVQASEAEQATQTIAVETLKLGQDTRQVIDRREGGRIAQISRQSQGLGERIAALPISPLIQSDMLDALETWRTALGATESGLREQQGLGQAMSETASLLLLEVSTLNASLSANADRIGSRVRQIIIVGGLSGFLLATMAAILAARSITRPLHRLETQMIARASDPGSGRVSETGRQDELGAMARATNHFLTELERREGALRLAKEDSESTLARLRETQGELIQAEKLASLGQLVAGVAHEINTPLGVALTTATVMSDDVARFRERTEGPGITRAAFEDFVHRMEEGARLTVANVRRSAALVHSFKQVAADQASGERRTFLIDNFAKDLFTSLGPLGKRAGHQLDIACESGIEVDTYPGALSQVLTNLLSNAYAHAYPEGGTGTISVRISRRGADRVRISFSDDGRGIDPENRAKVFDPFFTTGRGSGSTGLGLHIVYNLVTVTLDGTITMTSRTPGGTTFIIDLPTRAPSADASLQAA